MGLGSIKKIDKPPSSTLPLPVGSPQKVTIYTITQSLTLSNFFPKSPDGEFKFGHNIGKIEIYENKFSTPSSFVPSAPR